MLRVDFSVDFRSPPMLRVDLSVDFGTLHPYASSLLFRPALRFRLIFPSIWRPPLLMFRRLLWTFESLSIIWSPEIRLRSLRLSGSMRRLARIAVGVRIRSMNRRLDWTG